MGSSHWFILIPYYFFAALGGLLVLMAIARLVRASVSINTLVMVSIFVALLAVLVPPLLGVTRAADYTGARLLILGVATFVLAAVDVILERWLPLSLDRELEEM